MNSVYLSSPIIQKHSLVFRMNRSAPSNHKTSQNNMNIPLLPPQRKHIIRVLDQRSSTRGPHLALLIILCVPQTFFKLNILKLPNHSS
jgi:hypothetical protein